jgi:hypothetical protein
MTLSRRRRWSSRIAVWGAVCGLLLRAAVPLFAAGAAQLRGIPIAEVCPVYGVAMPAAPRAMHADHAHHHGDHAGHEDHGTHSTAVHTGDHCALTALAVFAAPEHRAQAIDAAHAIRAEGQGEHGCAVRDRCAVWAARLEHGPPTLA